MEKAKIIALLEAKFTGVRKDGLIALAQVIGLTCATEEEVTKKIEALTKESVDAYVKEYRGAIDRECSAAAETREKKLREQFDLTEKKNPPTPPTPPTPPQPNDAIAEAIKKAMQPLMDEISAMKGAKQQDTRRETFTALLKDTPESVKKQMLGTFDRMSFKDDDDFNTYCEEVKTNVAAMTKEITESGLSGHSRPNFGNVDTNGVSSAVADFIKASQTGADSTNGKEIVTK